MSDPAVESLILDLLEWLVDGERTYAQVMEAWRTSCPKLPIWEEANDRGLISTRRVNGRRLIIASPAGLALLEQHRTRRKAEEKSSLI